MASRRDLGRMALGGLVAAAAPALLLPAARAHGTAATVEIRMRSSADGGRAWFDPLGLLIAPGTLVRWVVEANVHTATAYHPANGGRSLRMPPQALPWDSGYLVEPGESFTLAFEVPGVYDYFCLPHEHAGMVGRLIVGSASGPGAEPFDYFLHDSPPPDWLPVPAAAQRNFPPIERILAEGVVPAPA